MSDKPLLEMRGIKLQFGEKAVLDGIDLRVERREVLVIMGLSGGGKSTLLGILLRLLEATAGTVTFKGEELTGLPRRELNKVRTHIGMVFQNAALVSSMTVGDNLRCRCVNFPTGRRTKSTGPWTKSSISST